MIAVQIENLWKEYRLGVISRGSLAEDVQSMWCRLLGKEDPNTKIELMDGATANRVQKKRFFALRGIDLEINQGDIVGIIGKNGAGKSTLLKILSRITKPTRGCVRAAGKTASLLEVGTGFHPELTGRENIYLNGAILGMSRREVTSKLDQIIEFAGVETFVDTPVKRYSSGMFVRLAFAVAAHLDPEILIVDEVLAVGDAEFQERCLGKMKEVSREGRTVIFVSHQMNAVESLCTRGVILEGGRVSFQSDNITQVVRRYLVGENPDEEGVALWNSDDVKDKKRNPYFHPTSFGLFRPSGERAPFIIRKDEDVEVRMDFEIQREDPSLVLGFELYDEDGAVVLSSYHSDGVIGTPERVPVGQHHARAIIPRHLLNEGVYMLKMVSVLDNRTWLVDPLESGVEFRFRVQGGLSQSIHWQRRRVGVIAPILSWNVDPADR
ncbi:MAG: polysaccharide ABC transporter ATP-binding protein [Puniceicoccales bacterium]